VTFQHYDPPTSAVKLAARLGIPPRWMRRTFRSAFWALLGATLAILFALIAPKHYRTYTVLAVDAPTDLSALGNLAGLAAQLGVQTASGSSPFYYAAFGDNTDVLTLVLNEPFRDASGHIATLIDRYRPGIPRNEHLRLERAIADLRADVDLSTDIKSGLITLRVTQGDPSLSVAVAESIVSAIDLVGRKRLRNRASAEREFAETSLHNAEGLLHAVEDSLQRFYERNRNIENSPSLKLQEGRIIRQVTLRQELVSILQRQLEEARLSEIRQTPLLTVVQHPLFPGKASWPKKSVMAIVGFIVGLLLGLAYDLRSTALPSAHAR
jgi:uncharacterized protein involved in exopolysaccharide biosynthesis